MTTPTSPTSFESEVMKAVAGGSDSALYKQLMDRLLTLRSAFLDPAQNATLVLGAGVSCSAGLPNWDTLIARLLFLCRSPIHTLGKEIYNLSFEDLTDTQEAYWDARNVFFGTDLLEIAQYLDVLELPPDPKKPNYPLLASHQEDKTESLKRMVKYALMPKVEVGTDPFSVSALSSQTIGETATLAARFFSFKDKENTPRRRSVITYNFDNLLEHCIHQNPELKHITPQAVYDKADPDHDDYDLHIYHPHGYLDLTGEGVVESKQLILSEESFYDLEKRNYSWENFLLARALLDSTCLMIGFSGNDYNFRRILKNLDTVDPGKNITRYMLVTIDDIMKRLFAPKSTEKITPEAITTEATTMQNPLEIIKNDETSQHNLHSYLALKEAYWHKKGFLPIWTTIEDLPNILRYLNADPPPEST